MCENIQDDRFALAVEIHVHGELFPGDVFLHQERRLVDHAFGEAVPALAQVAFNVSHRRRPIVIGRDRVHAEAEKSHGRLEDERLFPATHVGLPEFAHRDLAEEEIRVHSGQQAAQRGLVLHGVDMAGHRHVAQMRMNPFQRVLGRRIQTLPVPAALLSLSVVHKVQAVVAGQSRRKRGFQYGLPAPFKIIEEVLRDIRPVEQDHGNLRW